MIDHLAYVKCDECGNPAEAVCGNAREARLAARITDRFKRIDNRDLCPQCVASLAGEDDQELTQDDQGSNKRKEP